MTHRRWSEQFPIFRRGSKLEKMPLRSPRRLPKHLNRETSLYSRMLAKQTYQTTDRTARRRRERWMRFTRKLSRLGALVVSEFRTWLVIGACVMIVTTVMVLLFAPFFDVRQIHIRRQDPRIDLEDIQQTLKPLFKQRLLLVTKNQVSAMLQNEYPDIDHVDIVKDYPSTLTVSIYLESIAAAVIIDDSDASAATQTGAIVGSGSYAYITRSGYYVNSPIKLTGSTPIPTLRRKPPRAARSLRTCSNRRRLSIRCAPCRRIA